MNGHLVSVTVGPSFTAPCSLSRELASKLVPRSEPHPLLPGAPAAGSTLPAARSSWRTLQAAVLRSLRGHLGAASTRRHRRRRFPPPSEGDHKYCKSRHPP